MLVCELRHHFAPECALAIVGSDESIVIKLGLQFGVRQGDLASEHTTLIAMIKINTMRLTVLCAEAAFPNDYVHYKIQCTQIMIFYAVGVLVVLVAAVHAQEGQPCTLNIECPYSNWCNHSLLPCDHVTHFLSISSSV